MTVRRLAAAAIVGIAALGAWLPASVQQDEYQTAVETMQQFLSAWVIDHNEDSTRSYFGAAALETFAPRSYFGAAALEHFPPVRRRQSPGTPTNAEVWADDPGDSGYWVMLNAIWPSGEPNAGVQLRDILTVDLDVQAFITEELSGEGEIVHEGAFMVFAAYDDIGIHSFDAGYGDVAEYLKPSREKPTLILIAGFRNPKEEVAGPFVSFWGRDGDEAWRIQALGAYPKY